MAASLYLMNRCTPPRVHLGMISRVTLVRANAGYYHANTFSCKYLQVPRLTRAIACKKIKIPQGLNYVAVVHLGRR
eukprot:6193759-Pleurochrysis_carterae.AAC.1